MWEYLFEYYTKPHLGLLLLFVSPSDPWLATSITTAINFTPKSTLILIIALNSILAPNSDASAISKGYPNDILCNGPSRATREHGTPLNLN
ncbi:MAG: hypothetical protein ACHQ03_08385 [Candidatus Bathyarchaeia archaeon]